MKSTRIFTILSRKERICNGQKHKFQQTKRRKRHTAPDGSYLGRHKLTMAVIAILVAISAGANILGTYLLKPVINTYIIPGISLVWYVW